MAKFRLTAVGPDSWDILADGIRVGELHCSWAAGYNPRFDNPNDQNLAVEFWLWLMSHRQVPTGLYRWL